MENGTRYVAGDARHAVDVELPARERDTRPWWRRAISACRGVATRGAMMELARLDDYRPVPSSTSAPDQADTMARSHSDPKAYSRSIFPSCKRLGA